MVLSPGSRNMRDFFEQEGNHIEGNKIYDVTKLFRPEMIVSMPNNIEYYKAIASLFEEQQAINILKDCVMLVTIRII